MKSAWFLLILAVSFKVGCASSLKPNIVVDSKLAEGRGSAFVSHQGTETFDTYLAMNLPYGPTINIREQIEQLFDVQLKDRGEAHITVITPPEYQRLSDRLNMTQIEALVGEDIQDASFQITCLGRATASSIPGEIATFYLVVVSQALFNLRHRIERAYIAAGGANERFDAATYQPHITIGFTDRDLFESDGADKSEKSCIAPTLVKEPS